MRRARLALSLVAAALGGGTSAGAQGQATGTATPRDTMPRDTTPPAAVFGVTEYRLARQKLEQDMQRTGFSVYIIADMEGLAAAVRKRRGSRYQRRHDSGCAASRARKAATSGTPGTV